jgi:hypothetical protein
VSTKKISRNLLAEQPFVLGVANGDVFFTETPPVATLKSHDMDGWKAGEGGPAGLKFIRE